jgi:hypothetical protein
LSTSGLSFFTSADVRRLRLKARRRKCCVSFNDPLAILTKRRLSWKLWRPVPFGNVRTDTVGAPHDLPANRVFGKGIPSEYDFPNLIGQFPGQFVNPKIFKICPAHKSATLLTADH